MNRTRNPDNPFVYNANYYENAKPYTESIEYYIHKANNIAAFSSGIFLVCLLTYLILTRTPIHFRPYSRILLLCALNDSIILAVHIILQTRLRISESVIMVSYNGPISRLPYPYHGKVMGLQGLGATIALASLPLQYYYRYMTLKLRKTPSHLKVALYYLILISFVIMFMFLCAKAYTPKFDDIPDYDYAKLWYQEKPVPQLVVGSFLNKWMIMAVFYVVVLLPICYGLIIWLARATIKELKVQKDALTARTKVLQNQFSRTLFVQALTPLVTNILPLAFICFAMFTKTPTGYAGDAIILAFTWFPSLNSLSNIIFIGPYRMHCRNVLAGTRLCSAIVKPVSSGIGATSSQMNTTNIYSIEVDVEIMNE